MGLSNKELLIQQYQKKVKFLARKIARKITGDYPSVDDLEAFGYIGLLEAREKYNSSQNVSFNTFAEYRIRGAMLDHLRECDPLSRRQRTNVTWLRRKEEELEHKLGRSVTQQELANALEISIAELSKIRELGISRNYELNEEDIQRPASQDKRLERADVRKVLSTLRKKDRDLLELYYIKNLKLTEIGKIYGITESRVSQMLSAARERMKQRIETKF